MRDSTTPNALVMDSITENDGARGRDMSVSGNPEGAGAPACIRVIVAHPDAAVRAAVGEALADEAGIEIAGVAASAVEAIGLVRLQRPAIVLVDLPTPASGSTAALVEISAVATWSAVAIAGRDDSEDAALAALRRGAAAIVPAGLDGLGQALRTVAAGGAAMPPRVAMALVRELRAPGAGLRVVRSALTPREWEILDLLSGGASMREAAAALEMTGGAVHAYLRRIHRKLGVRTPAEAGAAAASLRSAAG